MQTTEMWLKICMGGSGIAEKEEEDFICIKCQEKQGLIYKCISFNWQVWLYASFSFHWYYFVTVCLLHEGLELDPMNLFLSKLCS